MGEGMSTDRNKNQTHTNKHTNKSSLLGGEEEFCPCQQSSGIKPSTAIWKSPPPPWEHLIVSCCFRCFWGCCAFFVLGFLSSLMLPLCDLSIMSLCLVQGGCFQATSDTGTPGYAGPDVFPVCQTAWGSSSDVSMSHSSVLRPKVEACISQKHFLSARSQSPI